MENNKENINSAAIAPDETAVKGTVENNNPTTNENNEVNKESSDVNAPKTSTKSPTEKVDGTKKSKKDYTPHYTNEEKEKLKIVTEVVEQEIAQVLCDMAVYGAVAFPNQNNVLLHLNTAVANGVILTTPEVNRVHGKDELTTGASIMSQGAQHPLLVITRKMADAAGIKTVRFANDPDRDKPIPENDRGLVVIDGNGRFDFLLGVEKEEWPELYAVFPQRNRAGFYDLPTCMNDINTEVSKWKTPDLVQKRILEEGDGTHPGWTLINRLTREGFGYQSACQIATLKTDRIIKSKVCSGEDKDLFLHFDSASSIYKVLSDKFAKDLTPLKTKELTKEVSVQWNLLQKNLGDEKATEHYLRFLDEYLTDSVVKSIQEAKAQKEATGKVSKDEVRKNIIQKAFYQFTGKYGLKID